MYAFHIFKRKFAKSNLSTHNLFYYFAYIYIIDYYMIRIHTILPNNKNHTLN